MSEERVGKGRKSSPAHLLTFRSKKPLKSRYYQVSRVCRVVSREKYFVFFAVRVRVFVLLWRFSSNFLKYTLLTLLTLNEPLTTGLFDEQGAGFYPDQRRLLP